MRIPYIESVSKPQTERQAASFAHQRKNSIVTRNSGSMKLLTCLQATAMTLCHHPQIDCRKVSCEA